MKGWIEALPDALRWPGAIGFAWPSMLWLLSILPLLVAGYVVMVRRRPSLPAAVAQPRLPMIGDAGFGGRLRRHLPAVLMGLALAAWLLAIARPQAVVVLPSRVETVVLALDMSGSMRADDVKPTRLAAAQSAAKAFVADQPRHVRIGVVAVAGTAAVVQSPTHQREEIVQSIDRLQPQRGTALGAGLIISLATLLPEARIDVEREIDEGRINNGLRRGAAPDAAARVPGRRPRAAEQGGADSPPGAPGGDAGAVTPGSNTSAVLVLLSDGVSNTGPEVASAIELANQYGVRVYTVGVGTSEGASVSADGWSMRVRLDEEGLRQIAAATGAEYFRASDANELKRIYRHVGAKIALQKQSRTEVSALFVGVGALLAAIGALLSMTWFHRLL